MKEITKEDARKKVRRLLLKRAIDTFSLLVWEKVSTAPEKSSEELLSKISGLFVAISIALEE